MLLRLSKLFPQQFLFERTNKEDSASYPNKYVIHMSLLNKSLHLGPTVPMTKRVLGVWKICSEVKTFSILVLVGGRKLIF